MAEGFSTVLSGFDGGVRLPWYDYTNTNGVTTRITLDGNHNIPKSLFETATGGMSNMFNALKSSRWFDAKSWSQNGSALPNTFEAATSTGSSRSPHKNGHL